MRSANLVVAAMLAGLLPAAPAGADATRGQAARVLTSLVIRPQDATAACNLRWRSKPYRMVPDRQPLIRVLDGWLGESSGVDSKTVQLGLSSVYWEGDAGTATIIGFAFTDEAVAARAERLLVDRFAAIPAHRVARRGRYLVIFAAPEPMPAACTAWMWQELGRRLAAAP